MEQNNKGRKIFFEDSEKKLLVFETLLSACGVELRHDSDLYRIGFHVLRTLDTHKNPELHDNKEDLRIVMREVMGFNNFIEKVSPLLISDHRAAVVPHLRLLSSSSIPQSTISRITDQGSNKLFEVYVAGLCYPTFQPIELDSPERSKGDNPDVTFRQGAKKWGIACKVLHSFKAQTIIGTVIKGIDQIEKSDCDTGFVMLNLKNTIDHDRIWPLMNSEEVASGGDALIGTHVHHSIPGGMLRQHVLDMRDLVNRDIGRKEAGEIFEGKKAQPMIVASVQGATGVMYKGSPQFQFITFLGIVPLRTISAETRWVVDSINDHMR